MNDKLRPQMKVVTTSLLAAGIVAGCTVNLGPNSGLPAILKINSDHPSTLIGRLALPHTTVYGGITKLRTTTTSSIDVSDGDINCSGSVTYVIEGSLSQIPAVMDMPIQCSNSKKGSLKLIFNPDGTGIGQGQLDSGEKIKAMIGPISGKMDW